MTTTSPRRYLLRLTPNGAPPLADTRAHLDVLLVVFAIGAESDASAESIAAHVVTSLNLEGRVHLVLEPMPTGPDAMREYDEAGRRARAAIEAVHGTGA